MILIFLVLSIESRIDSVEKAFAENREIQTLLELSKCYITAGDYHKSMELVKKHERHFTKEIDKARLMYESGSVYMFAGEIAKAHDIYLRLIGTYPKSDIANDAAERLYLIEAARDDTVALHRLVNLVRLFETEQHEVAVDTAKKMLKTQVGAYAYYFLALTYNAMGDLPMALGTLVELNREYAQHDIIAALLFQADLYVTLEKTKEARKVLEDLIVREPNTIYALKARQRLKELEEMQ